jgi:hypothetical protein
MLLVRIATICYLISTFGALYGLLYYAIGHCGLDFMICKVMGVEPLSPVDTNMWYD